MASGKRDRIRVMTWNVLWRFGERWGDRQPAIRSTIAQQKPDVIGLQETWVSATTSQAAELGAALGMHAASAVPSLPPPPDPPEAPDQEGYEVGIAVLSRWPIVDAQEHLLSSGHRPAIVALAVTVDHPTGRLHAVNVCLDWERRFEAHRLNQARALVELATDPAWDGLLPVFLLGDMNAPPDAPGVKYLSDALTDTWTSAATRTPDDGGITLRSRNALAPLGAWQIDQRIDYIFARAGASDQPLFVDRAAVIVGGPPDLPASDHDAVAVDIRAPMP